jgi:hypothetical protein
VIAVGGYPLYVYLSTKGRVPVTLTDSLRTEFARYWGPTLEARGLNPADAVFAPAEGPADAPYGLGGRAGPHYGDLAAAAGGFAYTPGAEAERRAVARGTAYDVVHFSASIGNETLTPLMGAVIAIREWCRARACAPRRGSAGVAPAAKGWLGPS